MLEKQIVAQYCLTAPPSEGALTQETIASWSSLPVFSESSCHSDKINGSFMGQKTFDKDLIHCNTMYVYLVKTGSLDNAIQDFSLAKPS